MGTEGFTEWRWRGARIDEPIEEWARKNGFPMVTVEETTREMSIYGPPGGREMVTVERIAMPQPFALGLPAFEGSGGRSITRKIVND